MTLDEVLSLIVTLIGVFSFATIFTILYRSFANASIAEINSGKRDVELMDEVIYEQQVHVRKRKKITGIIKTVIFYSFLATVIPLFVFSVIDRIHGNVSSIGDNAIMVVASGSMSYKDEGNKYVNDSNLASQYNMDNQFAKYDIIVLKEVTSPSEIGLYDVIAFRSKSGQNIIHRVVKIEKIGDTYRYTTQGDARPKEDGLYPTYEDVIGVYTSKKLRSIGMFVLFFQSYAGMITILSLIYCLFMIDKTNKKIIVAENERLKLLGNAIDYKSEENLSGAKTEFFETIYYKGYAYRFNEEGFIDKSEIEDKPLEEKSNDVVVKVVEDVNSKETITEEIEIPTIKETEEIEETEEKENKLSFIVEEEKEEILEENIDGDENND